MKYTKQEKKNYRNFILNILITFIGLFLFGMSFETQKAIFGIIGNMVILLNSMWMFYIGYSHGWELRGIRK